jgi:hypothetical protein
MSVSTVDDAVARMRAIAGEVPAGDGVGVFDRMYLRVTETVGDHLATGGFFSDDAFMADLDVRFANLFFAAYDATGGVPQVWSRSSRRGHAAAFFRSNSPLPVRTPISSTTYRWR